MLCFQGFVLGSRGKEREIWGKKWNIILPHFSNSHYGFSDSPQRHGGTENNLKKQADGMQIFINSQNNASNFQKSAFSHIQIRDLSFDFPLCLRVSVVSCYVFMR